MSAPRSSAVNAVGLGARLLGDLAHLLQRSAALRALAAAFPDRGPDELGTIARASARLRMRRNFDPFARLDDVALCRRLTWTGAEPLRAARASTEARYVSAPLGVPALALRTVRLYGGDPAARIDLLPARQGTGDAPSFSLLGRSVPCATAWAGALAGPVFPVFATLAPQGGYCVELQGALAPADPDDPRAWTRAALECIEQAVRERPESWPWSSWGRGEL